MLTRNFGTALLATAVFLGASPLATAQAQPTVPTREGNIWSGAAHEPNPTATIAREKGAGIALSPKAQRRQNNIVEQLDRQLESTPVPPAPGTHGG